MAKKTKAELEAIFVTGHVVTQQDMVDLMQECYSEGNKKIYRALLSQAGVENPTSLEMENSLGTVTWTATVDPENPGDISSITVTCAGVFTENKTWAAVFGSGHVFVRDSVNSLTAPTGGTWDNLAVEIIVYP